MTQSEECPSSSATKLDDLKSGDRLQCSTRMQNFSGELLLVDRKEGIFVLRESKGTEKQFNLHFVRFAELQALKKLSSSCSGRDCSVPTDSSETARRRLAKVEQRLAQLWVDSKLSEAAKRTFIELKRIFDDVVWNGDGIKVLKCVMITEPFDESGVECLDSRTSSIDTLALVKKILARRCSPCSSSRVVPHQQCVVAASPPSSTPSTLVQPEEGEDEPGFLTDCDSDQLFTPSSSTAIDLFLDASQSEGPKAPIRTHCAASPLRASQCFSSSEELEMVTPPTFD